MEEQQVIKKKSDKKIVVLSITCVMIFVLFVAFAGVLISGDAKRGTCMANVKYLYGCMSMYIAENDGTFPDINNWPELLGLRMNERSLYCPAAANQKTISYGFNINLSEKKGEDFEWPNEVILVADSDNENHILTGPEDIAYRHWYGTLTIKGDESFLVRKAIVMRLDGARDIIVRTGEEDFKINMKEGI